MGLGKSGKQTNHLIASPITVLVVEGLEIIQIGITRHKVSTAGQQALDVLRDGNIARQKRQRVGMPGCLNTNFSHRTNQLLTRSQTLVTAIFYDNKTIREVALVLGGEDAHQLINVVVAFNQTGFKVGVQHA